MAKNAKQTETVVEGVMIMDIIKEKGGIIAASLDTAKMLMDVIYTAIGGREEEASLPTPEQ